jgi:signal transduction histidine kinase/CheY-like chemotaxis protein/HPt (histidine-containing phosphotransfer) domain-containing protein
LEQGHTLTKLPDGFPQAVLPLFQARHIKAFIVIPIMVGGSWWGVFCLLDCLHQKEWTDSEQDSFRAMADMFGAAIERQKIQNALVQAKDAAEAASQAKSQFLANMSHEIRTPITGVIGMLQLLQRTELDKHQSRYAANAFTSAKTLLTVIGDVLDFSKIEAGKMELEELCFDPAEVVDTVTRLFAERAEDKGIELMYRLAQAVPRQLRGDSNRLRQVLVNLVGNAVKFTSQGEVVLSCERLDSSADTTTLHFEVRDTGCGIALEKQKLIFDPFSQADNSMTRKYGGTGLGLTISRQFCQLMGGSIGLQSTAGHGSTFSFTLAFKNSPAAAAPHLLDLRKLRVLVVDDCPTAREINREWIAAWHGQAEEAADAAEALQKLERAARTGQPFQVAVLDWKMPGMDGLALGQAIKARQELSATGLVLLSSFTQQGSSEIITAAGFAAFIPKPAGKSDLYDALITAANGEFKTPNPGASALAPILPPPPGRGSGTVLLAEDNEINREVATEMLAALGYQSRWVDNGRDAIAEWRRDRLDLILMDCQMPEMDGYEAARTIRIEEAGHPHKRHVPIVALTAHATKGDRDLCLAAGMDDYLTKPLDPELLAATLAKWLPPKPAANPPRGSEREFTANPTPLDPIDYPSLLRRCMGKPELAARLVRTLVQQAEQDLQAIATAVQQNDAAALAASAHRLKGAAANVSAEGLRQAAAELEALGRQGATAAASALREQAQLELARLQVWRQS